MNLDNLNLVELNAQEQKEIEGGFWDIVLFAVVAIVVGLIMNANPDRVTVHNE